MSYITTVLLTHHVGEDHTETPEGDDVYPIHEALNDFFDHSGFREIAGNLFGGSKFPACVLLAGAFNYLDLDGLCAHMRGLDWQDRETVQLIVMEEHDERFRFVDWAGG